MFKREHIQRLKDDVNDLQIAKYVNPIERRIAYQRLESDVIELLKYIDEQQEKYRKDKKYEIKR